MANWKTEIECYKFGINGLHGAIEKYLEFTGYLDRVSVDDLETVCQLTGVLSSRLDRETFQGTVCEFIVYHGFDLLPTADGFWTKLPSKNKL
jgi:hypothetical protein